MRMRWAFADEHDTEERSRRDEVCSRIDGWWAAFSQRASEIVGLFKRTVPEWDLPTFMREHLGAIHPRLMWEFGPGRPDGHRLVITPEGERHLLPLVRELLRRAPQLQGWEFLDHRPADPEELARLTIEGRTGASLEAVRFELSRGEHHLIDLTAYCREPVPDEALFVAAESLLGEDVLERWIGVIEAAEPAGVLARIFGRSGVPPGAVGLGQLRAAVEREIEAIRASLPSGPRWSLGQVGAEAGEPIGAVLKLEPEVREEYHGWSDLLVASTHAQELWLACHASASFDSERYSRHGELFAYLKLDGRAGLDTEKFPDRAAIEDALDEALREAKAGAVMGGGTGLIYSYVELALADVSRAAAIIRKILRDGNIHKRSWILFHDRSLADEWIGICDDTPPPPRAQESMN
jgi:hypothetical protein